MTEFHCNQIGDFISKCIYFFLLFGIGFIKIAVSNLWDTMSNFLWWRYDTPNVFPFTLIKALFLLSNAKNYKGIEKKNTSSIYCGLAELLFFIYIPWLFPLLGVCTTIISPLLHSPITIPVVQWSACVPRVRMVPGSNPGQGRLIISLL